MAFGQKGWSWHIVGFCHQFRRYPQLLSTSTSKSHLTASQSRKSGGIRRVWAVEQAAGRHNIPLNGIMWEWRAGNGMQCHGITSYWVAVGPEDSFYGVDSPPGTPAQIDVLRSCVFGRKYRQKVTVSLGGYPQGYITEPQLWIWRDCTPECGVSATPKATILTRTGSSAGG